jgi:hypothetical protein
MEAKQGPAKTFDDWIERQEQELLALLTRLEWEALQVAGAVLRQDPEARVLAERKPQIFAQTLVTSLLDETPPAALSWDELGTLFRSWRAVMRLTTYEVLRKVLSERLAEAISGKPRPRPKAARKQ